MNTFIMQYNENLNAEASKVCQLLASIIDETLVNAENKIWHAHPVWFINENPIVGYSLQKAGVRLMFWSGADFEEDALHVKGKKFKDASIFYTYTKEINKADLVRWLNKSKLIQWDYKNIVKRRGRLERIEIN